MRLVEKHQPIIGEQLAEILGISRPTVRSDLSLLVKLGYLDAKPKVGYFIGQGGTVTSDIGDRLLHMPVRMVQAVPVVVRDTTSVYDAVVTLFLEDVGSLIITDKDNHLSGIVSRKDLLKSVLGNTQATTMPVSMVMTRYPNVITVYPDTSVVEAARKMIDNRIDTLPVVVHADKEAEHGTGLDGSGGTGTAGTLGVTGETGGSIGVGAGDRPRSHAGPFHVVGRVTKTTMTKVLLEIASTV